MAKNGGDAPAPDPAIGQAALKTADLGQQWLDFTKDAFTVSQQRQTEIDDLAKQVTQTQLANSQADRQRYEQVFQPLENKFVDEANNYASPERQDQAAATARANVQSAAEIERGSNARRMAAVGVNPASGRYAGIDRAVGLGTALASVGAQNQARQDVRDKATALQEDAINIGRGLPTQSSSESAMALGATDNANAQYLQSLGIMNTGYSGNINATGNSANILQNQYNSQLQAWQTQQDIAAKNASGIGGFLGTVGGALLGNPGLFLSSKKAKTAKESIAKGEALDAVNSMPVESWTYKPGLGDDRRHVGPYAEDFRKETGRGDGRTIPAQDAIGITMKAVQDLNRKVNRIAAAVGLGNKPAMKRAA